MRSVGRTSLALGGTLLLLGLSAAGLLPLAGAREQTSKLHAVAIGPGGGGDRIYHNNQRIDVHEIDMLLTNSGGFGRDLESPGGPAGTFYPRGSWKTCLYSGGLWIGGMAPGGLRVTVAEYSLEYQPGRILEGGGWADPGLPEYRVYKLTPSSGPGDADYDEWPAGDGAPVDAQGLPLRAGGQTLWSVFNDADPAFHTNDAGGTPPIGVEVSHLTYAYDTLGPLDRVIVMDYRIWHRGEDALQNTLFGIWLDIDLGESTDDLVGCDSLPGLAFSLNGSGSDGIYGPMPPAVGVTILSGPDSGANPAYAATDYINGTDPSSPLDSYNYLQGLDPYGNVVIDPVTGRPTRYWHSGDPVTGTGWIDDDPRDKRSIISVGPLEFSPGQIESLRIAFVIGQGSDRLASLVDLKQAVRSVRRLEAKKAFPRRSRWAIAGFYPDPFDPTLGAPGNIFVVAPEAGRIQVSVLGPEGDPIRTLLEEDAEPGLFAVSWDGTNAAGDLMPPGTYRFQLRVLEPEPANVFVNRDSEEMSVVYEGTLPETASVDNGSAGRRTGRMLRGSGWIALPPRAPGAETIETIGIIDVNGRLIRRLTLDAGAQGIWWDGRDDRGLRAPAGLYFLRAERGASGALGRVLLLR